MCVRSSNLNILYCVCVRSSNHSTDANVKQYFVLQSCVYCRDVTQVKDGGINYNLDSYVMYVQRFDKFIVCLQMAAHVHYHQEKKMNKSILKIGASCRYQVRVMADKGGGFSALVAIC